MKCNIIRAYLKKWGKITHYYIFRNIFAIFSGLSMYTQIVNIILIRVCL